MKISESRFCLLGFTLAEMMVVMLIMSIIMAAMAPVMTTRMKNDNSSPWRWAVNKVDAYFGNSDRQTAMIGQTTIGNGEDNAKLIIRANNTRPNHILFKQNDNISGMLRVNSNGGILLRYFTTSYGEHDDTDTDYLGGIGIGSNISSQEGAIAIGTNAGHGVASNLGIAIGNFSGAGTFSAVAIGSSANSENNGIAIGSSASAKGPDNDNDINGSIAIGESSQAHSLGSISIGAGSEAVDVDAIAIGRSAKGFGTNSISIGSGANCEGENSVCIGQGSVNYEPNVIRLGTENSTVVIPGRLVVWQHTYLGALNGAKTVVRGDNNDPVTFVVGDYDGKDDNLRVWDTVITDAEVKGWYNKFSDRRLKYVGKENLDGLAKIRQLKVFNYTFKKDEAKTPRVGVMAQDLQKVFPNAVKKGADGFLTIRMEDMFYALINAVKELDAKVTALTNEVRELRKENKEIKQRLKALEAK